MSDKCKRCGACKECGAAPTPVYYPVYPYWSQPPNYVGTPAPLPWWPQTTWTSGQSSVSGTSSGGRYC